MSGWVLPHSGDGASRIRRSKRLSLEALAVFVLSAGVLGWCLAGTDGILGVDGYYHFRVAEEIAAQGPWVDIRWLPFTVLGEEGVDHHWLFHLLITPFTLLGHSLDAVQWAILFFGALIPAALTCVCRWLRVPYAPLFALIAVTASAVLPGRYLMLRPQGLAMVFMALSLVAMTRRHYLLLGLLAFLFMQFYHGAVMLVPLAAIWILLQGWVSRDFDSRIVVAVGSGLFLGLLLSPWFPENVGYLLFHTVFKMGHAVLGLVGTEWYPTRWRRLLVESWPAHLLLIAALFGALVASWRLRPHRLIQPESALFLIVALLFLVLYKRSWRFVDYYVPFACMAAGLVFRDLRRLWSGRTKAEAVLIASLTLLSFSGAWRGAVAIDKTPKMSPIHYGEIAAYLNAHGKSGEVVLNTHWPDFVQLVWHSPQFSYVSGLDGHYLLYGDDSDQFDFWFDLRDLNNFVGKDIGRLAVEHFGARWMVIPRQNHTLVDFLQGSSVAKQVLATEDGWLFELAPLHAQLGARPE